MGRGQNGDRPLLPCLSKEGPTCPGLPKSSMALLLPSREDAWSGSRGGPWQTASPPILRPLQPDFSPFSTEQVVGSSPCPHL